MSYIKKYLQGERAFANENYASADGFFDDRSSYFTASEDFFNADAMSTPTMGSSVPTSQPYIILVSNSSASAVSNFDVLGSYEYLQNAGFSNGNLTIGNVTISSGIANVTYQQFLYQAMNSPFSVGLTYLNSIAGSSSQVTQPMTLNTKDANGNQALKALIPTIDPYQNQNGVIAFKQLYRIDGYTKLTISTVLPNAVFQVQFYPADNINIARGLAGRAASAQFANPRIVKESVAVIGGQEVAARLG